ncbi:hypothetical protein E8E11_006924 [Didymella keratinophila]|nr:hypothetical protein E8E11_006924 [Didymella keratinophila]
MGFFPFTSTKRIPEEEIAAPTPEQLRVSFANARPSMRRDSHFTSAGAEELENTANWHDHGIFLWCCGHANTLVYHDGDYPFRYLKCEKCQHVLCKDCLTTSIITPLTEPNLTVLPRMDLAEQRELVKDLFQVCLTCGLSRLAQTRTPDHHAKRMEKALNQKVRLEHEKTAQKPAETKWEAPGHRRAQAVSLQDASKPGQPIRRRPELGLIQTGSLKRRGAVRGNNTPRPGSARSYRTDSAATPRTALYSDYQMTDRPEILPRTGTWATADERRRVHEPPYFASSETFGQYTQPPVPFDLSEDDCPSTPTSGGQIFQIICKSSTMTMHAPQPRRRYTPDDPVLPYEPNTGDKRHQPLERSHTIASCYGVIEEADDSEDEPTPRQAAVSARSPPLKVPSEKEWINARQSMIERAGDHAFDESRLDRVKDFLGAAMSFLD